MASHVMAIAVRVIRIHAMRVVVAEETAPHRLYTYTCGTMLGYNIILVLILLLMWERGTVEDEKKMPSCDHLG
jgi:hypothetical protein